MQRLANARNGRKRTRGIEVGSLPQMGEKKIILRKNWKKDIRLPRGIGGVGGGDASESLEIPSGSGGEIFNSP